MTWFVLNDSSNNILKSFISVGHNITTHRDKEFIRYNQVKSNVRMDVVQYDSILMKKLRTNIKTAGLGIHRELTSRDPHKNQRIMWHSTDPAGTLFVKVYLK